jgi:hypothetical protein
MRPDDVERQKILEGYGYHFLRINRFNAGKDPIKTLNGRLWRLCQGVWSSRGNHVLVDELKGTAEALKTGQKKICYSCNEIRDDGDFDDVKAVSGRSRKCKMCKARERTPGAPSRRLRRWRRR